MIAVVRQVNSFLFLKSLTESHTKMPANRYVFTLAGIDNQVVMILQRRERDSNPC